MNRIYIIILMLLLFVPSAQAGKKKTLNTTTSQLMYMEPDVLPAPLQPEQALTHLQDLVVRRRRNHTMGKRGIDVSHYQNQINWDAVADDNK